MEATLASDRFRERWPGIMDSLDNIDRDDALILKYLLGELPEDSRSEVEDRIFNDDRFFEQVEIVRGELTDAYIQGLLTEEERDKFAQHHLISGRELAHFALAGSLKRADSPGQQSRPSLDWTKDPGLGLQGEAQGIHSGTVARRAFLQAFAVAAAFMIVALGFGLGTWRMFFYRSDTQKGLAALQGAYRDRRPLQARISDFPYAPFIQLRGSDPIVTDSLAHDRAERILLDAVFEHSEPSSHFALGRFYLADRQFEKAIEQFETSLNADDQNAQLHSDLGVALLEKGKLDRRSDESGKGLEELGKALEHFDRALRLNSNQVSALFNRALTYQELSLLQKAQADWTEYLKQDTASEWSAEARRNLSLLEERLKQTTRSKEDPLRDFLSAFNTRNDDAAWRVICQSRDVLGQKLVWPHLLDTYLESSIAGRERDPSPHLQPLAYLGELEFIRSGDRFVRDLATFYATASKSQRKLLVEGRGFLERGRMLSVQSKALEAIDAYGRARDRFAQCGDVMEAEYASHWIAYSYLGASESRKGMDAFNAIVPRLRRQNYKWLLMLSLHYLAGAEYNAGYYSSGISHNREAYALAEAIGDTIGSFNTAAFLGEQFRYLGNHSESLNRLSRALDLLDKSALNPIQLGQLHHILGLAFASVDLPAAAAAFQSESLRLASEISNLRLMSLTSRDLGVLYGRIGSYDEGLRYGQNALETARQLTDNKVRTTMMAMALSTIADLKRQSNDFTGAIETYTNCLSVYGRLDFRYGAYEAQKNRLSCYISLGDTDSAHRELDDTLKVLEEHRMVIRETELRNEFFDQEQSVYDLAMEFSYFTENSPWKAFEYSEMCRARTLLGSVKGLASDSESNVAATPIISEVSRPLPLSEIQKRIPPDGMIVQYAILRNNLLIWVIGHERLATIAKHLSGEKLRELTLRFARTISTESRMHLREERENSIELYKLLIQDVTPLLDHCRAVYVVPDKELDSLPFSALLCPTSGHYLIEDFPVSVVPSSSFLALAAHNRAIRSNAAADRLLCVGNPRLSEALSRGLPDLPSATREAGGIAKLYRNTCLLVGAEATRSRVLREMVRSDVIHLSLHSVRNPLAPGGTQLLVGGEPSEGDTHSEACINTQDISSLPLHRPRLVVLSACETGISKHYDGEGMISLARPFMASGIPAVVVSLWAVDSGATADLMMYFHRYRTTENLPAVEALRAAQVDMLHSKEGSFARPYYWAAFEVMGGVGGC